MEAPSVGRQLTLLSAWFCPFVQRTWIALLEKGIPFSYVEVSLKDEKTGLWKQLEQKPDWFLQLNPLGKVPVLAWDEDGTMLSVYESNICNEFLEDYAPPPEAPALLPPSPAQRASCRITIDRFNSRFVPEFYRLLMRQDKKQQQQSAAVLTDELLWLENAFDPAGPFLAGDQFSLVDAAVIPWFIRMYVLKKYRGFELPERCKRLSKWYATVTSRPSVTATLKGPKGEDYETAMLGHYSKYADASANSTSAKDFGDKKE